MLISYYLVFVFLKIYYVNFLYISIHFLFYTFISIIPIFLLFIEDSAQLISLKKIYMIYFTVFYRILDLTLYFTLPNFQFIEESYYS